MKINFLNKTLISLILISSFTGIIFLNNNNNNNNNNKIGNSNVTVKQIESGVGFSGLVLNYDNSDHLYMWGRNDYGQLGIGNTTQQITPQEVDINQDGTLGNEGIINSFLIGGYANLLWSTDSSGDDHLYSWGRNRDGNLGIGQSWEEMDFSPIPVEIPLNDFEINGQQTKIQKIAISQAGSEDSSPAISTIANDIVITKDNYGNEHLFIWGDNTYGQLGTSEEVSDLDFVDKPFQFKTDLLKDRKEIQEIEIGYGTIGMVIDDSLYTWGSNVYSTLGIEAERDGYDKHPIPLPVEFDPDILGGGDSFDGEVTIKQIDFSKQTSAAVLSDANRDYLYTWGNNTYGQLGEDGSKEDFKTPQRIENISNDANVKIKKIFTDTLNTAVIIEGEVKDKFLISGSNGYGQFGGGNANPSSTSQFIECDSIIEDKIINLSLNYGSLIINTIDDSNVSHLYSWGNNKNGQLGLGEIGEEHYEPQELEDFIPSPSPEFITISTPVENSKPEFQMKVNYSLSLNSSDNNFFKENYINKIEVVDGRGGDGKVYGSINSEEEDIPLFGWIDLNGLITGNNYSSGDLYLKVTYNDNLIFGDSTSSAIPEFTVPKNDALVPTIESVSQPIFDQDKVGTIDYTINIPEETSTTEGTNVSKIEVVDSLGATHGSASIIEPTIASTGTITLENLLPGKTYSTGELYLKVTYIGSDGQEVEIGGSNEPNSQIPEFTVPKNDALVPTIESVSQPIFDQDKVGTIDYTINIPEETSTTEGTNVSKIEVVDSLGATHGSASIIEPTIASTGTITLENLLPGKTYSTGELYLKVTYIGSDGQEVEIGGSNEPNSQIPEFTVPKNDALVPTIESVSQPIFDQDKVGTIDYTINIPEETSTTEGTNVSKIEVVDSLGATHGSASIIEPTIASTGTITLENLLPGKTYSTGELYLKVTYIGSDGQEVEIGGSNEPNSQIPEFTVPKNDAALPTLISANVSVDTITNIPTGISYNINIPSGDPTTKDTVINKIEVTDGEDVYGSIEASADVIIKEIGIIPLNGPIDIDPGTTYNNLYLKVTWNDNQEIGDINDWKVEDFDVPKLNAESPSFNSATTFDVNSSSVFYDLDIPSNNPTTEPTIINRIEVTNGVSLLGYVDSSQGKIPNSGNIILENLDENTRYEGFYLVVYYNGEIFNRNGKEELGKVPTINNLSPPIQPTIVSTEVFDITAKSAIVKYEISISQNTPGVEDTILTKISIIDSSGNIYGEISDKEGLNPIGEIELTLKPSQTYEGLYLEVIYNGNDENHIGGSEIESSLIPSFKTKINPMIIYGSGIALLILIILIIIIIITSLLRKKAKIEKNYHINKSKK